MTGQSQRRPGSQRSSSPRRGSQCTPPRPRIARARLRHLPRCTPPLWGCPAACKAASVGGALLLSHKRSAAGSQAAGLLLLLARASCRARRWVQAGAPAGADDAHSNLAAVCHQHLVEEALRGAARAVRGRAGNATSRRGLAASALWACSGFATHATACTMGPPACQHPPSAAGAVAAAAWPARIAATAPGGRRGGGGRAQWRLRDAASAPGGLPHPWGRPGQRQGQCPAPALHTEQCRRKARAPASARLLWIPTHSPGAGKGASSVRSVSQGLPCSQWAKSSQDCLAGSSRTQESC